MRKSLFGPNLRRKPLEFPPEDAIKNVAVYQALLESASSGRRVEVPSS